MKKNNKGFTMLETLVASTLIVSTLVFLYIQFNNLVTGYDESFQFNTVQGIHHAKQLVKYYQTNPTKYCSSYAAKPCLNDSSQVSSIYQLLNVSNSILVYDMKSQDLDFSGISSVCQEQCQKFIKKVRTNTAKPRLVVIYQDHTFASMVIE